MYTPGPTTLGPHDERTDAIYPKSSYLKRTIHETKEAFSHPHYVSSALILIALVSFAGNVAFGYLNVINQGYNPEIIQIAQSAEQKLGSDDDHVIEEPPNFSPSIHFESITKLATLKVSALGYVVADAETGEIIIEKNADTPYPIASVSKVTTAIVAREHIDPRHFAEVTKEARNAYGTEGELSVGEKILVNDLYYPLLIESSNDAAEVLAYDFGRDDFMKLMNDKASALGMYSTFYEDPSGLSPNNISTAHDLTKLGLYVFSSYPELLDITRVREYSIFSHNWVNKNHYLTYPHFIGGKNGFINEAKKTTLSYFKVNFKGRDATETPVERPLMIVLLKSNDRNKDAALLLAYVSKNIRYVFEVQK